MRRIPKSFVMGPHTYEVHIVSKSKLAEVSGDPDCVGFNIPDGNDIYVKRVSKEFSADKQQQTFWHEFFHVLFATLGYIRLNSNERLVDQCALLMMQAHQTFRY